MRPERVDLMINMVSFQEMTTSQVSGYVRQAYDWNCPFLYSLNRDRSPHNTELSGVWELVDRHYWSREYTVLPVSYQKMLDEEPGPPDREYKHVVGLAESDDGMRSPRAIIGAPVFNHEGEFREAIESILSQTFRDFRLVIVDDCSTDATEQIARKYAALDSRVEYLRNDRRVGMIANWRRAFEAGVERWPDAEYFAWASDHDVWHPRWLASLVRELDANPAAVLAYPLHFRLAANSEDRGHAHVEVPDARRHAARETLQPRHVAHVGRQHGLRARANRRRQGLRRLPSRARAGPAADDGAVAARSVLPGAGGALVPAVLRPDLQPRPAAHVVLSRTGALSTRSSRGGSATRPSSAGSTACAGRGELELDTGAGTAPRRDVLLARRPAALPSAVQGSPDRRPPEAAADGEERRQRPQAPPHGRSGDQGDAGERPGARSRPCVRLGARGVRAVPGIGDAIMDRVRPRQAAVETGALDILHLQRTVARLRRTVPADHRRTVSRRAGVRASLLDPLPALAAAEAVVDPGQVVAVSRGGVDSWYRGLCGRYVDASTLAGVPEVLRADAKSLARQPGSAKLTPANVDATVVQRVTRLAAPSQAARRHPAEMQRLFRHVWMGAAAAGPHRAARHPTASAAPARVPKA